MDAGADVLRGLQQPLNKSLIHAPLNLTTEKKGESAGFLSLFISLPLLTVVHVAALTHIMLSAVVQNILNLFAKYLFITIRHMLSWTLKFTRKT